MLDLFGASFAVKCKTEPMVLDIDHLIICVPDLEAAADDFEKEYGLVSIEGGHHPSHGTANRIIPLGPNYIEFVSVVDQVEANQSSFGSWVSSRSGGPFEVNAVALRTDDLGPIARRLGLEEVAMSRIRPDGFRLAWKLVGIDEMIGARSLPLLIQWLVAPEELPGQADADHRVETGGVTRISLSGGGRIRSWVAGATGVEVHDGASGVLEAEVLIDGRTVALKGAQTP
jgi:hypothetical protein